MRHKERGQDHRAVVAVKPGGGPHVIFIGPVQALDELLKRPPFRRLSIEVLKPDDLVVLNIRIISFLSIQKMDAGRIGRIAVGNEDDLLAGSCGTDRLVHGNDRRLSSPVVRHVRGGDFQAFGGNEEEDVLMFPQDLDIRFITGLDGIDRAFMLEIEAVAVKRRGSRIVQDRLIRDLDVKDGLQNMCGFPGRNSEGDVKGKDQPEHVLGVVDLRKFDNGFLGRRVQKLLGLVMILPVLIAELELRASFFL